MRNLSFGTLTARTQMLAIHLHPEAHLGVPVLGLCLFFPLGQGGRHIHTIFSLN